jgi:uncharacterized protein YprB with RNaseH-like and TPR domain
MAEAPLSERLARLRRTDQASPVTTDLQEATGNAPAAPEGLAHLERSLLGDSNDGLTLKARLERLVQATAARDRLRRPLGRPLEELVPGRTIENERGEFFQVEVDFPLEQPHGDVPLSRLKVQTPATLAILAGEPGFEAFDLSRCLFLDTETTGLAGGAGTAAFLIGVGFVDGERFVVRQYFMRDYHEESALFLALAQDLAGFAQIVTFNGKMYDLPLLESRFRLNRAPFPLAEAVHLDLLYPARRLWKARLESCRLVHLEAELLRVQRREDIPGEQIPQVYFDYIRSGDACLLSRVFHHNRLDIVSLAALAALACQWVEEGRAEDPRDVLSLARVLERAEQPERSEAEYRRALEAADATAAGDVRRASLRRLAARAKQAGHLDAALEYWERAAAEGDVAAHRELAVLHEHYRRDLRAALASVERGLTQLASLRLSAPRHLEHDLQHRRERLLRRLAGKPRLLPPS